MNDSTPIHFTYRAFISYSHRDKAWADWLHRALETYRVPSRLVGTKTAHGTIPRRLNPVFRDRDELASAAELGRKVNAALAQSENLIVICSPASAASRWVNEEVLAYQRMGRGGRIFCLIVAGEPDATDLPGRAAEECFCPALRFQLDAQGQPTHERAEPIAADTRPGKDGKANAKLKLIAGMLDVGFDALKQRELQRRTRRMTAIAALALVVMAITSVLAVAAWRAKRVAEQERAQAEGLISFMLGDLHTKLEAVNRLDILNDVAAKAMAYFSSLPKSEVDDKSLAQRAQALELIGRVREEQGELPKAQRAFAESTQIMQRLVTHDPRNAEWKIALADCHSWLGYVAWDRGDLNASLAQFRLGAPLVEQVVRDHPGNLDWTKRLGWMHNNIGHVLQALGRRDEARTEFQAVFGIYGKLVRLAPANHRYQMELGHAYLSLAGVSYALGDLAKAQDFASNGLALWQSMVHKDPKDNASQMYLASAEAMLAKIQQARGQDSDAIAALETGLAIDQRLHAADPTSKTVMGQLAHARLARARLARLDHQPDHAAPMLQSALALYRQLATRDPGEIDWQTGIAESELEAAQQAWQSSDATRAAGLTAAAHALLAAVHHKHPDNLEVLPKLARTEILQGQLATAEGNHIAAKAYWKDALAALRSAPVHSVESGLDALEAHAMVACVDGDARGAAPIIARLERFGDRDTAYLQTLAASDCRASLGEPAIAGPARTHNPGP